MKNLNETVGTGKPFVLIGDAVKALHEGKRVRRQSWYYDKKFVFRQVPSTIPSNIVPKMQSLPQTVKDYFISTFNDEKAQIDEIYYSDQLAIVGDSNLIQSFSPTVEDTLAQDWVVLD